MADQTNLGKVYTHFQAKRRKKKTTPFGAAHAYMAYIRKYPPPPWPTCSRTLPPTEEKRGKGLATRRLPPGLTQCKQVFVYYTRAIWYSVDMPLPTHKTHGCSFVLSRPFYRYGGHIESSGFKEYYWMPRVHEHDPIHSLSIYARFSGQFFFQFS